MKLLLHACCGPCSLEPTRILREAGHDIAILYANSNIAPAQEHAHRLATLRLWADGEGLPVIEGAYDPAAWQETAGRIGQAALAEARRRAAGIGTPADAAEAGSATPAERRAEGEGEAGRNPDRQNAPVDAAGALPPAIDPARREARCRACYRLRLEETARCAAERGFEAIGTTLSVSPYQYTGIIREELERAAGRAGVRALFEDFRPFYDEATRRSRALGMYRQNYCGCLLSKDEAEAERAERKAARRAAREAERAERADEQAAREAERARKQAERAAYADKQARKHAILKALREREKARGGESTG